jgi:hypothetical protein
MRHLQIILLSAFLTPGMVMAKCPPSPCYAITFETTTCVPNIDVEESFPGARLSIKPLGIREVSCIPEARLFLKPGEVPTRIAELKDYYYQVWSHQPCRPFGAKPVTLFLSARCCDTKPHKGECTVKTPVLKDLPPWAQ